VASIATALQAATTKHEATQDRVSVIKILVKFSWCTYHSIPAGGKVNRTILLKAHAFGCVAVRSCMAVGQRTESRSSFLICVADGRHLGSTNRPDAKSWPDREKRLRRAVLENIMSVSRCFSIAASICLRIVAGRAWPEEGKIAREDWSQDD